MAQRLTLLLLAALMLVLDVFCASHQNLTSTYRYSVITAVNTSSGMALTLNATEPVNSYGSDVQQLTVVFDAVNPNVCRLKITDANSQRCAELATNLNRQGLDFLWAVTSDAKRSWEIPQSLIPRPVPSSSPSDNYLFMYNSNPFGFSILRSDTFEVIFNSSSPTDGFAFNNLIFEDQYIEISTQMEDDPYVYGLGERMDNFRLSVNKTYTIWNVDQGYAAWQTNLYGAHPFYIRLASDTAAAHGVLLLNSNAMDVTLSSGALTYQVIGGDLEFYFFMGPTVADVLQQYHQLIGTPMLPPYWALGWHQCRYGWPNLQYLQDVVANYSAAQIPLDTMWTDIDYMDAFQDFSFDPVNFPPDQMSDWVNELHESGMHYVVIVDPGIHTTIGYQPFDDLILYGLAILNSSQSPFLGQVWPGETVFPDFLNPLTAKYWQAQIASFHSLAPIDGLWIDMNEISNFCDGEEQDGLVNCVLPPYFNHTGPPLPQLSPNQFNPLSPPYSINNFNVKAPLNHKTLDPTAVHASNILEYDAHNLYGFTEAIATCSALEAVRNERCFVISRSTFPGSGQYGGHWTGDNDSDWPDMYNSIGGVLNFQFFGVPLVGADICGFIGNTTEELCGRWTALGSFYPFSRNHNNKGRPYANIPQEPYRWASVAAIAQKYLSLRYSLLPYYYTLFHDASINGGGVWQPLFQEFTSDTNTWTIDNQFMIGDALLITPVLLPNATSVNVYFPSSPQGSVWYEFLTGQVAFNSSNGKNISTPSPIDYIPLHIRGGYGVVMQVPAMTTTATRLNPFELVFALNNSGQSAANLYLDDGVTIPSTQGFNSTQISYAVSYPLTAGSNGTVTATGVFGYPSSLFVHEVTLCGASVDPTLVIYNGTPLSNSQIVWDPKINLLYLFNLTLPMNGAWQLVIQA